MFFHRKKSVPQGDGSRSLLKNLSLKSHYAESYRTLRTNLSFSTVDKKLKSLVVTSAMMQEGKSNTSANLGITMGQSGSSVLLIEADLRRPALSKRLLGDSPMHLNGLSTIIAETLQQLPPAGQVEEYGLLDLLELARLQQSNLSLDLEDDEHRVSICLSKGEIVDIFWQSRPREKCLTTRLLAEGILTEDGLESIRSFEHISSKKLAIALHSMGFLADNELKTIISRQLMEGFRASLSLVEPRFSFHETGSVEQMERSAIELDFHTLYRESSYARNNSVSYIKESLVTAIKETEFTNLSLLPAGPIPSNPLEILASPQMRSVLEKLKEMYDLVIIDSAPIIPASDTLMLAPQTDGVVLVVKAGHTHRKLVVETKERLHNSNSRILGVVLNEIELKNSDYYTYSYYG